LTCPSKVTQSLCAAAHYSNAALSGDDRYTGLDLGTSTGDQFKHRLIYRYLADGVGFLGRAGQASIAENGDGETHTQNSDQSVSLDPGASSKVSHLNISMRRATRAYTTSLVTEIARQLSSWVWRLSQAL
jgi:hypothetical protein